MWAVPSHLLHYLFHKKFTKYGSKWQSWNVECLVKLARVQTVERVLPFAHSRPLFLLSNPMHHIRVSTSTLQSSKMSKTFPPQSFSQSIWNPGHLDINQQGGPLLVFSSFNLMSAPSGHFPRLVALFFHVLIFFFKSCSGRLCLPLH